MFVKVRLLACCAALAMLASCVESQQPLSDLAKSQQDPRLYGIWAQHDGSDVAYVHVGREGSQPLDPNRKEPEPGLMRYWSITHSTQAHDVRAPEGAQFFCTKIGDQDFASWIFPADEKKQKPITYFLLKYHVDGQQLTVWLQDREATAKAIEAGQLKGVVQRKKKKDASGNAEIEELRITDTSENIAAFFAAGGAAACFPDSNKAVYTRVR